MRPVCYPNKVMNNPFKPMPAESLSEEIVLGDNLPSGTFHLHSRFRDVANFAGQGNDMVYVTTKEQNMSANGICIKNGSLPGSVSLTIENDHVLFGKEKINRHQTATYCSQLSFHEIHCGEFERYLLEIPEKHGALFAPHSLLFLLQPDRCRNFSGGFDIHFMDNALKAADRLLAKNTKEAVGLLKGTGRGLTPAGDDFIAGLLLGLHFTAFKEKASLSDLQNAIYQAACGDNPLVNSFLRHAKEGHYFYLFKNFVYSSPQKKKATESLKMLLTMGATSGADLLSGYIFSVKHKIGIWF